MGPSQTWLFSWTHLSLTSSFQAGAKVSVENLAGVVGSSPSLKLAQASLVAQTVKNLPAMQKTWVQSLGWEDPLEEGMAPPSSILAWRIPMDRGAWWVTVHGVAESDMTEQLTLSFTKPRHWVNQAAECHRRVGSRLRPLLLEISSSSHGAREPSPRSSWAGRGRAGMRELLMGGRSFGWPCARAPRVTGPVPKSQAGTSLVL